MLRLGIGAGVVFVVGVGIAWPVSFIAAIFTNLLLQAPAPIPVRAGAILLGRAAVAMAAVWYGAQVLMAYPVLFLLALTGSLFAIFRFAARGGPMLLVALLLIAVLLIPSLLLTSPELAGTVAFWLVINIALAILASYMFFTLLPPEDGPTPARPAKPEVSESEASWRAARMTLVTAPYAILHFSFGWSGVLPLIFIAMLAMALSGAASAAAGRNLLVANVAGGIVAITAYELLVIAPNFLFMTALVLAIMLAGARILASGGPYAPYAGSALNAMMILLGGAMVPLGGEVDAAFLDRMLGIGFAVLYIAAAYHLVESSSATGGARDVKENTVES
jgi:hypothetical protein